MKLRVLAFRVVRLIFSVLSTMGIGGIISKILRFLNIPSLQRFLWTRLIPEYLIVDGQRIYLDYFNAPGVDVSVELLLHGVYEEGTTCLFKDLIREGQTVVDLGAHLGYFTLLAAARVGRSGKVFAFEPEPSNYALLVKNIKENGVENVTPINKAIDNKTGVAELFLTKGDSGAHTIYRFPGFRKSIPVDTVTLDEFFRGRESPIDLVKMDIEGAEMAALEGMANIIEKNDNLRVITEFRPDALITAGVSPTGFLDMIKNYGFSIYGIDEEESSIQPVTAAQALKICDDRIRRNLFLVKGQWRASGGEKQFQPRSRGRASS